MSKFTLSVPDHSERIASRFSMSDGSVLQFENIFHMRGDSRGWIRKFRKIIYRHYEMHGREFPWRKTADPYRILVSEVMLQQTQVKRVMGKYEQFIESFPDPASLARAPFQDVFSLWHGLGYNRRAKALQDLARTVQKQHGGILPERVEDLMALPGIGRATASAIVAFAYNKPAIFIETNIRRVFIHFFFPEKEKVRDAEIYPLVEKTLDRSNPRDWYYAIMDYGSILRDERQNPNRRSAHYQRQAPFEGSSRQIRGLILKFVLQEGGASPSELLRRMKVESVKVRDCLEQLEKEGFLQKKGRRYFLA